MFVTCILFQLLHYRSFNWNVSEKNRRNYRSSRVTGFQHTATVLPTKHVLLVSGTDGEKSLSSNELYHISSNTWNSIASMSTAHLGHTATLLKTSEILVW